MRYLLAVLCPALGVAACGRLGLAVLLLVAQVSCVGWLPAALVALMVAEETRT